jgi:hypothetical protein
MLYYIHELKSYLILIKLLIILISKEMCYNQLIVHVDCAIELFD